MSVDQFRSGRVFYPITTTMINIPNERLSGFFQDADWRLVAGAFCIGMEETRGQQLTAFSAGPGTTRQGGTAVSTDELQALLEDPATDAADLHARLQALVEQRRHSSPAALASRLIEATGVSRQVWESAGLEMLEAVMPLEIGQPQRLIESPATSTVWSMAQRLGVEDVALASDFPLVNVSYGFTRVQFDPDQANINPFEPDPDHGGRLPIFVDQIQADALFVRLHPVRVRAWLEANGLGVELPQGSDPLMSLRAFFVDLLTDVNLRQPLAEDVNVDRRAAYVQGLLHSFAHMALRQAGLRAGMDSTSLAEYLMPKALMFAIHCNNRSGATIGALTSLYEQSLIEWMAGIEDNRTCVYDPVCRDVTGSCHSCMYLSETSCRFFNLNLGRAFLFGGNAESLGEISVGYFDASLN